MAVGDPITDLSDYVNLVTGGNSGNPETRVIFKDSRNTAGVMATPVQGRMTDFWTHIGQPCHGAVPTTAAVPTNATAGALGQTAPVGGRIKRLTGMFASASAPGTLVLYDRLSHQGGLSGTAAGAQVTNLPTAALTRATTGSGVEIWLTVYTAIGVTPQTVTASYTNQAGTAGQTTIATAIGNAGLDEQDRIIPLPIASGDSGVRAVASITLSGSTGTAGNIGITLAKQLVAIPLPYTGAGQQYNSLYEQDGPFDCNSGGASGDGCLCFAWMANSANVVQVLPGSACFFVEK